jgi:hypothetical protein
MTSATAVGNTVLISTPTYSWEKVSKILLTDENILKNSQVDNPVNEGPGLSSPQSRARMLTHIIQLLSMVMAGLGSSFRHLSVLELGTSSADWNLRARTL